MYISNNGKFKEAIVWWDTDIDTNADVDIFFFIHDYDKRAKYSYGFKSLEIDIKGLTHEEIFNQYKSQRRNELRHALKEGFLVKHISSPTNKEIEEYVDTYNAFAKFKGLSLTSVEYITSLCKDNKIVFSYIYLDNILLTGHSHYVDNKKERSRLLHSFSTLNDFSSRIGADANKLLTHEDIIYFKDNGYSVYDFGGIGNVDGDNSRFEGIIRFKKQFGGKEVILWKGVTPNGKNGEEVYKKYWK